MSSVANGLRRLTEYKWGVTDAERGINAIVAQLVECGLAEAEVGGSRPLYRSIMGKLKCWSLHSVKEGCFLKTQTHFTQTVNLK